jgi:hypothetical protein
MALTPLIAFAAPRQLPPKTAFFTFDADLNKLARRT